MGVAKAEVTLHVGAGTFQPVRAEHVEDHTMHSEYIEVDQTCDAVAACQARGGRVIAVGTTAVRSLESAAQLSGEEQPLKPSAVTLISFCIRVRTFMWWMHDRNFIYPNQH